MLLLLFMRHLPFWFLIYGDTLLRTASEGATVADDAGRCCDGMHSSTVSYTHKLVRCFFGGFQAPIRHIKDLFQLPDPQRDGQCLDCTSRILRWNQ